MWFWMIMVLQDSFLAELFVQATIVLACFLLLHLSRRILSWRILWSPATILIILSRIWNRITMARVMVLVTAIVIVLMTRIVILLRIQNQMIQMMNKEMTLSHCRH